MLTKNLDYIFFPKAYMGASSDGCFVGLKDELFFLPYKVTEHGVSKITTTTFTLKGRTIQETVEDLLKQNEMTTEMLKQNFREMFPGDETISKSLAEYKYFKINNGFFPFTRAITIVEKGKLMPWQVMIKDKPFLTEAKSFYSDKLK